VTRLAGKVALITGGGTGIGRACSLAFAKEGARVAIAGRRKEPLEKILREIESAGGEAFAVTCDVTRSAEVENMIRAVVTHFSRLDVLVNNAGAVLAANAESTTEAQFDHLVAVNLKGTFLVSRAALAALRQSGGGSIVNIGSILGLVALRDRAAYCAAKGGVTSLTRAMALDHAGENIRVNCICPSIVETELLAQAFAAHPDPADLRRQRVATIPLGRIGQPGDVARLAVFLASDESAWITGAAIPLDGGLTAY
jgi:NAD(P)-dependent dehydrogenase (short-subunit alcohol dehydrogenase family)